MNFRYLKHPNGGNFATVPTINIHQFFQKMNPSDPSTPAHANLGHPTLMPQKPLRFGLRTMLGVALVVATVLPNLHAAKVETLEVQSAKMGRTIPVTVITPDTYATSENTRYPVVYTLHGAGGSYTSYTAEGRPLTALSDQYQLMIVCPDGGKTSWWLDSPIDPSYQYETFVAKELINHIDQTYRTLAQREKRAIVGGSMGGHGACYLGIRNKAVFGAVGNIFGGVDLRPFPDNWDIKLRIGSQQDHLENWDRFSVLNNLDGLKDGELSIISMVGSGDFFLQVNRDFNARLQKLGIQHYYIESKGKHEVAYENQAFGIMFRFFDTFFHSGKGAL